MADIRLDQEEILEDLDQVDNDMYPNDGYFFQPEEPEQQKKDRALDKSKTTAAIPLLKDLIARLQARIAHYDSVDAIPQEDRATQRQFMIRVEANTQTRDDLTEELAYYLSLLELHS